MSRPLFACPRPVRTSPVGGGYLGGSTVRSVLGMAAMLSALVLLRFAIDWIESKTFRRD